MPFRADGAESTVRVSTATSQPDQCKEKQNAAVGLYSQIQLHAAERLEFSHAEGVGLNDLLGRDCNSEGIEPNNHSKQDSEGRNQARQAHAENSPI